MESFFETGSIKIGTLYDYNDESKYGSMVSDSSDGIKTFKGTLNQSYLKVTNSNFHPALSAAIHIAEGSEHCSFSGITFTNVRVKSPNLFIFSTAHTYSNELHDKWLKNEKYDSCYEIFDPEGFFNAISIEIQNSYLYIGYHKVNYINAVDVNSYEAYLNPAVIKGGEDFGEQCEVRAIWKQKGPAQRIDINHRMVNIKNPHLYCRPFKTI